MPCTDSAFLFILDYIHDHEYRAFYKDTPGNRADSLRNRGERSERMSGVEVKKEKVCLDVIKDRACDVDVRKYGRKIEGRPVTNN